MIALTNKNQPEGLLKKWHDDPNLTEQVRIYSNSGYYHAGKEITSENEISWWKFKPLVQILEGKL